MPTKNRSQEDDGYSRQKGRGYRDLIGNIHLQWPDLDEDAELIHLGHNSIQHLVLEGAEHNGPELHLS